MTNQEKIAQLERESRVMDVGRKEQSKVIALLRGSLGDARDEVAALKYGDDSIEDYKSRCDEYRRDLKTMTGDLAALKAVLGRVKEWVKENNECSPTWENKSATHYAFGKLRADPALCEEIASGRGSWVDEGGGG